MERKKWKPNFFDIIIVIVVVALAGGVYLFTRKETAVETKPLTYRLELAECPSGLGDKIMVGTELTDNVKNYPMGKVIAVETKQSVRLGEDKINARLVESPIEGYEDVIITVEAQVTESASEYKIPSGYVVRAGKDVAVKGNGFAGKGYILSIER